MAGLNRVTLIGNLGKDPEVRHLESGATVANFSLATTESYNDKSGNRVDQTEWHNVVLWRGLAETAEKILSKGKQIYLEGKIRTRSWEDKDGNKRYTTEILGDKFIILGRKGDDNNGTSNMGNNNNEAANAQADVANDNGAEDDLPF